jgi:hypothetical protein
MKKIICFIKGHNIKTSKCPVTDAKLDICLRCSPKVHSKMSFK